MRILIKSCILLFQFIFPLCYSLFQSGNNGVYLLKRDKSENNTDTHTQNTTTNEVNFLECGKNPGFRGNANFDLFHPGTTDTQNLKPSPKPFIINGTVASRGEVPWMVAITRFQHNKQPRWKVVCGAALMNGRFVLTASHCVEGRPKEVLEVVINLDDATKITVDALVIRKKIKRIISHPKYNSMYVDNDIALIELDVPLTISELPENVWPVCLPKPESDYSHFIGIVSGWGYTDFDAHKGTQVGQPSSHLRKVSVPILSYEECLKTMLPEKNNITRNMLCAGYVEDGGYDSCLNDSGGPLTIEENGISYLVGLVSWGIGCGLSGYPGVYTLVANYIPWILENIHNV